MKLNKVLLIAVSGIMFTSCALFQKNVKKNLEKNSPMVSVSADSSRRPTDTSRRSVSRPRPYKDVITSKAMTDDGLFKVHRIDDRYFFEIADSLLGKNILIVNRISKAAAGNRPGNAVAGYAGDQIGRNLVQFAKGPNHKLFVKSISYSERSADTTSNGLSQALMGSNFQPIVAAFDIKAYRPDSGSMVIDLTDYLNTDNSLFFFEGLKKKWYGLGGFQPDKSYISGVSSFPINVEMQTTKTYALGDATSTYELNTSMLLLPDVPMTPRYFDERVGYFNTVYLDFDEPNEVAATRMITRWRLEPKSSDMQKYLRGELVEPQRPIIYYIDPATPKKWIPYLIQGVNDWQKAFEKAGFKNAIYALEAPVSDPEWSLFDARHSAIIYKPSVVPNASGPHINDPRSGEILETHINWYHNVMKLLRDWYFIQASPLDFRARKMQFDDELMGQLIRFVSSHEVGHTLGLAHNFGSSSTVPVENLRNKKWVEENGHTPSIMDYARFNYVAQPEDNISEKGIFPRIGVYDEWAIEWGYRLLPQLKSRKEEKTYMNNWIIAKLKADKRYTYGPQNIAGVTDSRNQSEDLGDNAMKAGNYGIRNLKRVMTNLVEWTIRPDEDYKSLEVMNEQVIRQFQRYVSHVVNNIGVYNWTRKTVEQDGSVLEFTPREKQKEAVAFLHQQLFETPNWLINKEIFSKVGGLGHNLPFALQRPVINTLISYTSFSRLFYFTTQQPDKAYSFDELLTDLETGIWSELKSGKAIDVCRRNLQKIYAERLREFAMIGASGNPDIDKLAGFYYKIDMYPIIRNHIKSIVSQINKALPLMKDKDSYAHLELIKERLKQALESKFAASKLREANEEKNEESLFNKYFLVKPHWNPELNPTPNEGNHTGCWRECKINW